MEKKQEPFHLENIILQDSADFLVKIVIKNSLAKFDVFSKRNEMVQLSSLQKKANRNEIVKNVLE